MNLATVGLPVALGIIMLGLGLTLTTTDFTRVARRPRAVAVALATQLILLPAVCFGLVQLFDLTPVLALGMLLLAASPGGPGANLYSHLFGGDVALNITLTAVNSVIAVVSLPIIYNLSAGYFSPGDPALGLQLDKAVQVFAVVLVPVVIGMLVRRRKPAFAQAMNRPVRIGSIVVLAVLIVGTIAQNFDILSENFSSLAAVAATFGVISMLTGYVVPRLAGVSERQAVASAFEIGLHNGVIAIVIAQTIIGSEEMSLPAGIYSIIMLPVAAVFGFALLRRLGSSTPGSTSEPTSMAAGDL